MDHRSEAVMGTKSKFAAGTGAVFLLYNSACASTGAGYFSYNSAGFALSLVLCYNSATAGPLVQNSPGAEQQAQQWMISCSLSVNTARRLSKHILTKLCFFNYIRVSLACTRNIEKNISLLA